METLLGLAIALKPPLQVLPTHGKEIIVKSQEQLLVIGILVKMEPLVMILLDMLSVTVVPLDTPEPIVKSHQPTDASPNNVELTVFVFLMLLLLVDSPDVFVWMDGMEMLVINNPLLVLDFVKTMVFVSLLPN